MNTAFLLTGGNLGNRLQNLEGATALIAEKCGAVLMRSSIYETAAWGYANQPDFYNQALAIHTKLDAENLMAALLEIENTLGRKRSIKMGPRNIDIDILLMNNLIYNSAMVTIPHPQLSERKFVLMPLAEIAADIIHPVFHKTIQELLLECKDELPVHKISANK